MCGSVALVSAEGCLYEQSLFSSRTHSKRLLPAIEQLLHETGLSWDNLDGLAVSLGPGSFTGLRIGLTTAKSMAMATGLPLFGVASLDGLASQAEHCSLQVCPLFDARKKEVYAALYQDNNGAMCRISEYLAIPPQQLCERITIPTLFMGDGVASYGSLFKEELGELAYFASPQLFFPRAATIGKLALDKFHGQDFLDPALAVPIYIRPSEAEINLRKKGS